MLSDVAHRGLALCLTVGLACLLAGCGGKRLSTSVADQRFEPGQPTVAASSPESPPPSPPPLPEARLLTPPSPEAPPTPPQQMEPAAPTTVAPAEIELADAYFDFDQATLRSDARSALEADARTLKADMEDAKILIEGHCDERGTASYNLVLGEKRARAAERYLRDLGVESSHIQITSYGKERPVCTEHSLDCWQTNRRAHLVIK